MPKSNCSFPTCCHIVAVLSDTCCKLTDVELLEYTRLDPRKIVVQHSHHAILPTVLADGGSNRLP